MAWKSLSMSSARERQTRDLQLCGRLDRHSHAGSPNQVNIRPFRVTSLQSLKSALEPSRSFDVDSKTGMPFIVPFFCIFASTMASYTLCISSYMRFVLVHRPVIDLDIVFTIV
jgi:hypothetical protein